MASASLPHVQPSRAVTWLGLLLALLCLPLLREAFRVISPNTSTSGVLTRELAVFACAAGLLLLVKFGEGLPLRSIGLGTSPWWKSAAWGVLTAFLCTLAAVIIAHLTGYGQRPSALDRLPSWLVMVVIFRAGIVEELFYRGYAIERLQVVGLGKTTAIVLPLLIFGLAHYTGGVINVVMALIMGAILTAFYVWRRDLVANMIAHTLVDLVGNLAHHLTK